MALKIDKDTRLIDVDFGPVSFTIQRTAGELNPDGTPGNTATFSASGNSQMLRSDTDGVASGSFIQFVSLDLSFMTKNNEVMQPTEVSVQRTCQTPFGTHENGNNFDILQEFILITSRPLDNKGIIAATQPYDYFNLAGLNMGSTNFSGTDAGGLTQAQTIYAERRAYAFSNQTGATLSNGELVIDPPQTTLASIFGAPTLLELNTWGSLSAITGPNLYCYRVIYSKLQSFGAGANIFTNVAFGGLTTLTVPPVNVAFLCKDPKYSEGQYLTRLANAMNSIPEDGPTA